MFTTTSRQISRDNRIRYTGGFALIAILALGEMGCRQAPEAVPPTLTPVQVATAVEARDVRDEAADGLRYTGSVTADTQVDLSFKQGGYIEEILQVSGEDHRLHWIQQGDPVRAGQTLARIRPGDFSTRVSIAQAQQSQSLAGLAQAQAALQQAHASADQAAGGLREAQAGEEASLAALSNARVAITQAEQQTEAARIGRQTAEAQRNEAHAAFTKAQQDFDRAEALYKTQSLTRTDYDAARAAYDVASARLRQADEGIEAADNRILQSQQQEKQAQGQEKQAVAQLAARRSQVRQAQARLDASQGAVRAAQAQVETARAGISGASSQVRAAEIPLEETSLKSPIDGVLIRRAVEVGQLVGPSAPPAFTIADTSKVKVVFGVPDSEVKTLQLGQRVPVRVDVLGPTPLTGRITAISPAADPRTRVFNVEVTVLNRNGKLKVGMIATLDLTTKRSHDEGVAVPLAAVVRQGVSEHGAAVLVVTQAEGHAVARLRPVQLGSVYGNHVMVSGIRPGEQIIAEGTNQVRDGEPVKVAEKSMEDSNGTQD